MIEPAPLLPDPDEDAVPFWEAAAADRLVVQRCLRCSHRRFPPRPMCPRCRSLEVAWEDVSGRGTIWSFVVVHPPVLPAYTDLTPYPVVVVALDEDPTLRMVGNVVARRGGPINEVDPASIEIGAPVHVSFEQISADVTLPRWVLY